MKPCSNNRQLIAWLAVDELDACQERALRQHLAICEGCSRYLQEISSVKDALFALETRSDIQTSESFHRRVVGAVGAEAERSTWRTGMAQFRAAWLSWQLALPVVAATLLIIVALSGVLSRPGGVLPAPGHTQAVLIPKPKSDLAPTFSNYQMVANRSLDKLEELLTRQANRNPPSTLIYTASALARADAPE